MQIETASHLVDHINRGGLLHPSEICHEMCVLCWKLISFIRGNKQFHENFLLSRCNHKALFYNLFEYFAKDHIFLTECENSHLFIKHVAGLFFNCAYKSFISESKTVIEKHGNNKVQKLSSK